MILCRAKSKKKDKIMDKTAWIVVTLCAVLLGINMWFSPDRPQQPTVDTPPVQQETVATPEQQAATDPAAAGQTESAAAASGEQMQQIAPEQREAHPLATLTSRDSSGKPVASFVIQDVGGSLKTVEMLGKAINSTKHDLLDDVQLNSQAQQGIGTLMFGLSNEKAPVFDSTVYSIVPEETNERQVTVEGKLKDLMIRKIYPLKPLQVGDETIEGNAYCLELTVQVQNTGKLTRLAKNWGIYAGATAPISSQEWSQFTYYIRNEDKSFHKEGLSSFRPWFGSAKERVLLHGEDPISWVGVMNQYYATIVQPVGGQVVHTYYAAPLKGLRLPGKGDEKAEGVESAIGMPEFTLAAGGEGRSGGAQSFRYDIFAGPKLNLMLSDMTKEIPKIDHIMDYGVFHVISYPMNWLINVFHGWFENWGWAIVAMTFVVRLLIWPLYRKSYMSMKSMSLLQPKVKEIREKYSNDQQKASMEMMKLYREYGISPMGGCLPMFLQIPIFFSFFYVLQTAAEFRGAPFIGWVHDLSQMDTVCTLPIMGYDLPINVLPIVMAITMILQMRMNPQVGGDPMQQRIMKLMPLFFFAFCYYYPSALALYWTTTNLISIIQTWIIRRMPQPELTKVSPAKRGSKKGFFERMAEAQQAALAEQRRRNGN